MNPRVIRGLGQAILAALTIVGACVVFIHPKVSAVESPGRQWLAAMDTDHDGTVSKDEFNKYMDAQFDKADVDHDGTLDAKELAHLRTILISSQ